MRRPVLHQVEMARVRGGRMGSDETFGPNGMFMFRRERGHKTELKVISSDGGGWEHVSVSTETRCPTWEEMDFIKGMFWDDDECVMQLHPPRSEWVNNHQYCLHLWKPIGDDIPRPPSEYVGVKNSKKPVESPIIMAADAADIIRLARMLVDAKDNGMDGRCVLIPYHDVKKPDQP